MSSLAIGEVRISIAGQYILCCSAGRGRDKEKGKLAGSSDGGRKAKRARRENRSTSSDLSSG